MPLLSGRPALSCKLKIRFQTGAMAEVNILRPTSLEHILSCSNKLQKEPKHAFVTQLVQILQAEKEKATKPCNLCYYGAHSSPYFGTSPVCPDGAVVAFYVKS